MQRPRFATRVGMTWVSSGLLVVLTAVSGLASLRLVAKAVTPTPTISSAPASATSQSTATFAFTDKQAGVSYSCSLDGGGYVACTSPKTYSGLADGSHSFQVTATASGMAVSSPASHTWVVDATPPTTTVTFPHDNGTYGSSTFAAGCSPIGVCGTVTDATGVAAVTISLLQQRTGKYWNGASFTATTETAVATTLGKKNQTPLTWNYALALPADGVYTVHVQASDVLGNAITVPVYSMAKTFFIATTPPPPPTITSYPDSPTYDTTAQFRFGDTASVNFRCSLDGAAFIACTSPDFYSGLATTSHTFQVEAVDSAGNVSAPISHSWVVLAPAPVTITSAIGGSLYPGGQRQLTLKIANPYNFPINVTNIRTQVQDRTSLPTCVNTIQGQVSVDTVSGPESVPANASVLVQTWARMADLPTINQDGCKGAAFTFIFSAAATK